MRERLNHLGKPLVESLDGDNPPPLVLSDEQHAFTIDLVKRICAARRRQSPPDYGQVVVFLAGAVLCGWADPRPHIYGPAILRGPS